MQERLRAALRRNGAPYGVALFDVDFFSTFRKAYGEANARETLARIERWLRGALPPEKLVLEPAGDATFLAIFPGASLRESADLADRMRMACGAQELRLPGVGSVAISVSAGVVCADGFSAGDDLLAAAHDSLRTAKHSGRNCVAAGASVDLDRDARALQLRHAWRPGRGQTPTIGRESELAQLGVVLESARFVTLAGPSGVGKTHLALALAAALDRRFPDGIFFIDLSEAAGVRPVQMTIAEGLGVRQPDAGAALRAAASLLRRQEALLILDDCSCAPLETAAAVASLLEACPMLRVLVTALAPMGAIGERVVPVGPLDETSAVRLYRSWSGAVDERGVRAICRRLQGNPFALGLVAGAPGAQSLEALARELEGLSKPEYLLEWRFSNLDANERALLPRLAVFRGGWNTADAAAVCGESATSLAPALRRLSEARLVAGDARDGFVRFRLPRAVREFARRILDERGETAAMSQRHADHFASVLTASLETWSVTPARTWVPALERELGNIRAALHWSIEERQAPQTGARLARGSADIWSALGLPSEGAAYTLALLDHPALDEPARALLNLASAQLLLNCGRPFEARTHALAAAAFAQRTGDELLLARATHYAAYAAFEPGGDRAAALEGLERSLAVYRRLRNRKGEAESLNALAIFYHSEGEFAPALERYREALTAFRSVGVERGALVALSNIGALYYMNGEFAEARTYFHECAIRREHDVAMHRLDLALLNLGETELALGHLDAAAALLGRATRLLAIAPNEWVLAMTLTNIARIAIARSDPRTAATLSGFADAAFERLERTRQPTQDRLYRSMIADAEMQLGGEAFQHAYAAGRGLSVEAAIDAASRV